jgi:hypothetical protein
MSDELKPYASLKAVPNSILNTLKSDLNKGEVEEEFDMLGHKWKVRVLDADARSWAFQFVNDNNVIAYGESLKAPQLAAALQAVDGIPVDELFQYPEDMKKEDKDLLSSNPLKKKYWVRNQLMLWIVENLDPTITNQVHKRYVKLAERRDAALGALPNF